jgi:hypothetical protein
MYTFLQRQCACLKVTFISFFHKGQANEIRLIITMNTVLYYKYSSKEIIFN